MIRRIIFAAALLASPAIADTVTLQIENDAGMVTTREGYTQTECDAAALLLNGSKDYTSLTTSGTLIINACPYTNGCWTPPSQPHTPRLTKAQCMRPTQGTKP